MAKEKTTSERGQFKGKISTALYKNSGIRDLLLGDTSGMSAKDVQKLFKDHVKSHLFIDDTIAEAWSFIFYDVRVIRVHSNTKTAQVIMYAICHRDILENYSKDGYFGNRADILSQMIEDALLNDPETVKDFGIGDLVLKSVDIYNATRFYGTIMTFEVPTFR